MPLINASRDSRSACRKIESEAERRRARYRHASANAARLSACSPSRRSEQRRHHEARGISSYAATQRMRRADQASNFMMASRWHAGAIYSNADVASRRACRRGQPQPSTPIDMHAAIRWRMTLIAHRRWRPRALPGGVHMNQPPSPRPSQGDVCPARYCIEAYSDYGV